MVHLLVHFLELKVGMNEYVPDNLLLAPSPLLDQAWRALILETQLYEKVLYAVEDFHGKPRKMIHYTVIRKGQDNWGERFRRTQSLFHVYFREEMPLSFGKERGVSMPILDDDDPLEVDPVDDNSVLFGELLI